MLLLRELFLKALDKASHRGPDRLGYFLDSHGRSFIEIGVKLRVILGLDKSSNQPLVSSCGRFIMFYDSEINYYMSLKETCLQDEVFQTKID